MRPPDTGENPAISLSKVDLPQPLGPTTVTNSLWRISKSIFSSAPRFCWLGVGKNFETFWTLMTVSGWRCADGAEACARSDMRLLLIYAAVFIHVNPSL